MKKREVQILNARELALQQSRLS